jgi:hypothetical protein
MNALMGVKNATVGSLQKNIQNNSQSDMLSARGSAASASYDASQYASTNISGANKRLAESVAKGDYANEIAGNQAKVQDAQMTPPSTSGQVGGEAFNLIRDTVEVNLRFKMIDPNAMVQIGEYWLRYGYSVRRFFKIGTRLRLMSKFTYWKLSETYVIAGPMPEFFKQTFRGIFEKGVTVYGDPADIGTVDMGENQALGGVAL